MKDWDVSLELFWSANHVETFRARANTERKAVAFAEKAARKKYPSVGIMLIVRDVKEAQS